MKALTIFTVALETVSYPFVVSFNKDSGWVVSSSQGSYSTNLMIFEMKYLWKTEIIFIISDKITIFWRDIFWKNLLLFCRFLVVLKVILANFDLIVDS